jgi:SP family galactose:H+ symporter-like MFS transporter
MLKNNFKLPFWCLAFGGIFYGYNTGDIGAILLNAEKTGVGTLFQKSLLMGAFFMGLAVTLFFLSFLVNRLGRYRCCMLGGSITFVASLLLFVSKDMALWIPLRFFLGLAVGLLNGTIPVYLTESASASNRAKVGVLFQFFVVFGLFFSSAFSLYLNHPLEERAIFLVEAFLALVFLSIVKLSYLKETAAYHLRTFYFQQLSHKEYKAVGFALGIVILNQMTGINVFIQHDAYLLHYLNPLGHENELMGSVQITFINMLITFIPLLWADKIERKTWLTITLVSLIISLILMAAFSWDRSLVAHFPFFTLLFIFYIVSFAIGPGALIWTVITEILPASLRAQATPFVLGVSALTASLFSALFMPLQKLIGFSWIFAICALCSVIYVIIAKNIPPTYKKTLENIETEIK